jgi:hypothetical protein
MDCRRVKWDINVLDTIIKRPCQCTCCLGCNKNGNDCSTFGSYYCIKCEEWRCDKCYNKANKECKNCLCEWN